MKKIIIVLIIAIIIFSVAYILIKNQKSTLVEVTSTPAQNAQTSTETSAPLISEMIKQQNNTITYTDAGYSPNSLIIKTGETVIFRNESSQSMWTASAMHPTHKVYPTTGGCLGSTFDACKGILPGDSWSFQFDIVGNWKYHNHLNPAHFGSITVE